MTTTACRHLDTLDGSGVEPGTPGQCVDCLAESTRWVHLRLCLSCGHVGCCDSSPRRHASAHADPQHPVVRSAERGEQWRWCYVDEAAAGS